METKTQTKFRYIGDSLTVGRLITEFDWKGMKYRAYAAHDFNRDIGPKLRPEFFQLTEDVDGNECWVPVEPEGCFYLAAMGVSFTEQADMFDDMNEFWGTEDEEA